MWIPKCLSLYIHLQKNYYFLFWVSEVWFSINYNNLIIEKSNSRSPLNIKLSVQYLKEKNNICIQVDNIQKNEQS